MEHELKIWPQYYQAVASGKKTFEVRENDRGFQAGDTVTLLEYDPDAPVPFKYVKSPELKFTIGYVLPIDDKKVVFSLLKIEGSTGL